MTMKILKWLAITLGALTLLSVVVSGSWVVTETALQATSGQEFCTVCHTMKPFAEAYAADVHGGNNPKGLSAACANCHLPHDSQTGYLVAKVKTGLYDVWAEAAALFEEPDWVDNLEHRESFVYDSGCLSCHSRLEQAENQTQAATFAHQTYFKGAGAMHCVTCHTQVGHKGLLERLSAEPDSTEEPASQAAATQEPSQ
ncbi:MAG: NapC/NirT family cytochrome c [Thiohalocapsa sp.]